MVVRQADGPAPGVFEIDLTQHREATLERFTVGFNIVLQLLFPWAAIGMEAKAVTHQDAVIDRAAHGAAKRVRRNNAPYRLAAELRLLFSSQRASQAAIEEGWQQAPAQKTKMGGKGVIRQNQRVGGNGALSMHQRHFVAIVDGGDGGIFIQRHVRRQVVRQAFHQRRRLEQNGARNVERLLVVRGADMVRQILSGNHLCVAANFLQPAAVGLQNRDPLLPHCGLVFAGFGHLARDTVLFHDPAQVVLPEGVEFEDQIGGGDVTDIVLGPDIVRHINGKTGVAPGGSETHVLRFNQHHFIIRKI